MFIKYAIAYLQGKSVKILAEFSIYSNAWFSEASESPRGI